MIQWNKYLVTIIISTILIIGIGLLLWNIPNNKQSEETTDKPIQIKLDESKDLIYDADYGFENKLLKDSYSTDTFYSKEELIVPYINIDSEYAKKVNNEIREIYEQEYNDFARVVGNTIIVSLKYEYFYNDDILSVVIHRKKGLMNAGASNRYTIYNFNLHTLDKASLEDCYKAIGYESKEQLDLSINTTINKEIESEHLLSDVTWNYDELFIDKNGKINLVVPSPALDIKYVTIEKENI